MALRIDRRLVLLAGGGVALIAGLALAFVFMARSHPSTEPPPASQGGLIVETGRDDDAKLDPSRPLRCFVGGQFVGELPLADCAKRNGVATGALDVGLDQAGALAATNGVSANITPLPPPQPAPAQPLTVDTPDVGAANQAVAATQGPSTPEVQVATQVCWRYGAGGWRAMPMPMALNACVQALFAGRCQRDDAALYGRWGSQSLRLADGEVETSDNGQDFTTLIDPWPGCADAPG